jgi:hypothetical protein
VFSPTEEFLTTQPGYLDVEVFAPGAHYVQPIDPNNVSWENPLLPSLNLGPLAQGDLATNTFILLMGFFVVFVAFFFAKKMKLLGDTVASSKGLRSVFNPA